MSIYSKLLKIQSEIRGLTKNKGAYNYDYLTGDKLLSEIRPRMNELQLLLMPEVLEVKTEPITYDNWNKAAKQFERKTEVLATVNMRMTWVDVETNETLTELWAGTGMNAFDKGFGSALTYGERYYLLKTFHIPTDKDDVDAIAKTRDKDIEDTAAERGRQGKQTETDPYVAISSAKTKMELDAVWNGNPQLQQEPKFLKMINERASQVK